MRFFHQPDPERPDLIGVLEFDGAPPLELHVLEDCALWLDDEGNVLALVVLGEA